MSPLQTFVEAAAVLAMGVALIYLGKWMNEPMVSATGNILLPAAAGYLGGLWRK